MLELRRIISFIRLNLQNKSWGSKKRADSIGLVSVRLTILTWNFLTTPTPPRSTLREVERVCCINLTAQHARQLSKPVAAAVLRSSRESCDYSLRNVNFPLFQITLSLLRDSPEKPTCFIQTGQTITPAFHTEKKWRCVPRSKGRWVHTNLGPTLPQYQVQCPFLRRCIIELIAKVSDKEQWMVGNPLQKTFRPLIPSGTPITITKIWGGTVIH